MDDRERMTELARLEAQVASMEGRHDTWGPDDFGQDQWEALLDSWDERDAARVALGLAPGPRPDYYCGPAYGEREDCPREEPMTEAMAWKTGYRRLDPAGIPEALWGAYWRGVHAGQHDRNTASVRAQRRHA